VLSDAGLLFPKQFSWFTDLSSEERTALEWLIESLGADVNYASLDPAVVSSVYEDAVVSKVARRQLGVHYTPFDLAKRIASALPFEKLEPNSRSVLDLACGSGTLLLAAHDRLQAIAPSELDAAARHNYVRSHITGFDVDEFAVQIARLSLLLHALPEGDGWHIEQRDALAPSHPALGQFSVVMTNPPWRQQRSVNSRRQERADAFVAAALSYAAPGGLIALILPATWLDSAASAKARLELTAKADVFEVWRLPEQTFGSASLAPCVILAERDGPRTGRTLFRRVLPRGGWRSRFFLEGLADEQHLTAKPRDGSGFLSGPVGRGTGLKLDAPTLSAVAHIQQGPVPEPPVDRVGAHGGAFRWLREAEDLPAYSGLPLEETIRVRYPEDFHRRIRDPSLFAAPKLLVSAKRWTNNPWRIKVGYDLAGVIPRETLYMIVPKQRDDTDLFWGLLAVLASSVASCWVDTYSPTLSIPRRVVASLPLPPAGELRALAEHGRTLAEATHQPVIDREILAALEGAVWDAYELDQATRARISAQLAGFRAPEGTARFDVEVGADLRDLGSGATGPASRRIGATLDSNDSGDVKLWIPGLTEPDGDWHPVPDRFFGWLAAPQSTFDVRVRGNDIHAATYAFQPKTYQSAEELAKIFSYSETDRDADDCESQFEDG
jgi:predicted RNA methylase